MSENGRGKRKVMEKRWKLGKGKNGQKTMTWEERRAMWRLRKEAEIQRRSGKRVRIGYMGGEEGMKVG